MIESPETTTSPPADMEERKRQLAYQFWEEEGRPEGRAEEHWEKACLVVMSLEEDGAEAQAPEWLSRKQEAEPPAKVPLVSPIEIIKERVRSRTAA